VRGNSLHRSRKLRDSFRFVTSGSYFQGMKTRRPAQSYYQGSVGHIFGHLSDIVQDTVQHTVQYDKQCVFETISCTNEIVTFVTYTIVCLRMYYYYSHYVAAELEM